MSLENREFMENGIIDTTPTVSDQAVKGKDGPPILTA